MEKQKKKVKRKPQVRKVHGKTKKKRFTLSIGSKKPVKKRTAVKKRVKAKPKEIQKKAKSVKTRRSGKPSGKAQAKRKMRVEFKTRVPDGKEKVIRHEVGRLEDVQLLETNIDKLYSLVRREGQLKVREIAKRFGVDASLVEEWGHILEEHGLAELHYPAFGELIIRVKKEEKKTDEKAG